MLPRREVDVDGRGGGQGRKDEMWLGEIVQALGGVLSLFCLMLAHVLRKPFFANHHFVSKLWSSSAIMTRHTAVDISPPLHRELRDKLDRSVFHKTVEVLAVKVPPEKAGTILKSQSMRGYV